MFKNLFYNADGSVREWVYIVLSIAFLFVVIGGYRFILADNPPPEKILSQQYTNVLGKNLNLDDSLYYASYGFTEDATTKGVSKFRDVDLDWKKIDAKDLPTEVKSHLSQSDVDLTVYVADVDESLIKGITDVKHYVLVRHFNENNSDRLSGVYTVVKLKDGGVKVFTLDDAIRFITAHLVTKGSK